LTVLDGQSHRDTETFLYIDRIISNSTITLAAFVN
jgi:hypothetical protein